MISHRATLGMCFLAGSGRMMTLHAVDFAIIGIYFAMVLGIGFYLKRYTKSGEDFFLAGREMTAWVAGLSFVSANLGALELMGWAGNCLSVRHPGGALVLDGCHSRHAVPRHRHDALLLHFQDPLRPGLPSIALRPSASGLSAISFALMTILMSASTCLPWPW